MVWPTQKSGKCINILPPSFSLLGEGMLSYNSTWITVASPCHNRALKWFSRCADWNTVRFLDACKRYSNKKVLMRSEYHCTSELKIFLIAFFITGFFLPQVCIVVQIGVYKTRLNPNSSYMLNNAGLSKTTTRYEPPQ